jgi:hypothetical protein
MAKKSKKQEVITDTVVNNKFYAHYDKSTGNVFGVTNHNNTDWPYIVEITFAEYDRLVTGKDTFSDFHIGVIIQSDGTAVDGLVSKRVIQEHNFKNRLLSWIDKSIENADIEIHWDQYNRQWLFVASDQFRQQYYDNKLPIGSISFFVVLGKDPNFLLRSMDIDLRTLVLDKIIIPFDSSWESTIDLISLTSNLASIKYSLTIWNTHEQDSDN